LSVKEKAWKILRSYLKFQLIPLVAFGTAFSIIRLLTEKNLFKISDPNIFNILQHPLVFSVLLGLSALVLLKYYKNTWNAKYSKKWKTLFFGGSAIFAGLYAASANYFLNLGDLFFYTLNIMQNHSLDHALKPLPLYVTIFCFLTSQMFQSSDKNALTIYNAKMIKNELNGVLNYLKSFFCK